MKESKGKENENVMNINTDIINNDNNNNILTIKNINKRYKRISPLSKNTFQLKDKKINQKVLKILEYNYEEINDLPFEDAIRDDKRTYYLYYLSLIRTKHSVIFSFCYNRDYNSKILKIDLFFIIFAANYAVNGLFYNDETMHNIYVNQGAFDLSYQFPKITYSALITMLLELIMKILALSNDSILDFKKDKESKDVNERADKLNKKLRIKFIFYFVISFILLTFFWYYISVFGAVYRNTQIYLLQDTLISFTLSFFLPFFTNLIPGFFRIPSLARRRDNRECLYKFSKALQKF